MPEAMRTCLLAPYIDFKVALYKFPDACIYTYLFTVHIYIYIIYTYICIYKLNGNFRETEKCAHLTMHENRHTHVQHLMQIFRLHSFIHSYTYIHAYIQTYINISQCCPNRCTLAECRLISSGVPVSQKFPCRVCVQT